MEDKLVLTSSGEEVLKSNCRYIKSEYHKIGDINKKGSGQCYLIDGKYWRASTGKIVFNHSISQYVIKNNDVLIEGIIDVDEETLVKGYFNNDNIDKVVVHDINGTPNIAISDDIFTGLYYREILATGQYCHINNAAAAEFTHKKVPSHNVKGGLEYSCDNIIKGRMDEYNKHTPKLYKYTSEVAKHLDGLSFGVEFETVKGVVPDRYSNKLGLMGLRDGSVEGLEYVTIPLVGDKGVNTLINSCKVLNKYTEYDKTCALHIHIGNIPRTQEFLLAFFKMTHYLQNDMFKLFPLYKKYNLGVKRKHYTKPLPDYVAASLDRTINADNIDDNFNELYKWLSGGQSYVGNFDSIDDVKYHPSDRNANRKWNIKSR